MRARRTATRCFWSRRPTRSTRRFYDKLNFNFIRDIAPVAGITARRSSWWSIHRFRQRPFPSSSPTPRPIRARSTWPRPATARPAHVAGELFKMMTGVDMVHVPYRGGGARADRSDRRTGAGHVRHPSASIEHIRAGKLRALAVTTATRSEALPDIPTVGEFVPGYEASALVWHRRAQEHARRDRREAQQGDQCGPRRSQDQGAACRPGRHGACRLARRLRQAHRRRNREMGQGDPGAPTSSRSDPAPTFHKSRYANCSDQCPLMVQKQTSSGRAVECAPYGGQLQAAVLTGCRAWRSSY